MKVGTDGVLLGTIANGGNRILDIGTGTGLVALMMAQRYTDAMIDAIDIDADACKQAESNVDLSAFKDRIRIHHSSLEDFVNHHNKADGYDAIVCNPPFFENSLECPDNQRNIARHASSMPLSQLMNAAAQLLKADGVLTIIIPADLVVRVEEESGKTSLFIVRCTYIKTTERKKAKRAVLMLAKSNRKEETQTYSLMENGERTPWFKQLTSDFYL